MQSESNRLTALKTLSLRIRGYSEDTEELDSELANITGEVIDLTKTASNPQGISLFTDASQEHYKSMVDYLGEISDIWDEIDEKSKTQLLEKLFGKRGASVGSAIIGNFDTVRDALKEMEGAAGAADAEMGIIQESIDYKLNALQQTWVGTAQAMIDRGDIGHLIDLLTKLSEAIGFVVDKVGLLGSLGGIAGAIVGFKYRDELKNTLSYIGNVSSNLANTKFGKAVSGKIGGLFNSLSYDNIEGRIEEQNLLDNWIRIGGTSDGSEVTNGLKDKISNLYNTAKDYANSLSEKAGSILDSLIGADETDELIEDVRSSIEEQINATNNLIHQFEQAGWRTGDDNSDEANDLLESLLGISEMSENADLITSSREEVADTLENIFDPDEYSDDYMTDMFDAIRDGYSSALSSDENSSFLNDYLNSSVMNVNTEEVSENLTDTLQNIVDNTTDTLDEADIQLQLLNIGLNNEQVASENSLTAAVNANSTATTANATAKEEAAIASAMLTAGYGAEETALFAQLTGETQLTKSTLEHVLAMTAEEAATAGVTSADLAMAQAKAQVVLENYEIATSSRIAAAGEALMTAGISMLVGFIISKALSALSDLAYESQNLGKRVTEVKQSFNNLLSSANEYDKKSRELISDFEELSKGVDLLGRNVSLTDDEFETYKDISNQIADMFPELIKGWDDQGNAILKLRDNMDLLNESSKELKRSAYLELINGNKESGTKGANDILKEYNKTFDNWTGKYALREAAESFLNADSAQGFTNLHYGYKGHRIDGYKEFASTTGIDKASIKNLSDKELADIKRNIHMYVSQIDSELESEVSNVRTLADAYFNYALLSDDKYSDIANNDKVRDSISAMISSMDAEFINQKGLTKSKEVLQDYVNNILELVSDPENGEKASQAIAGLFSVDYSNMPLDQAKNIVDKYIDYLVELFGEDPTELKIRFGVDDIDKQYNNLISAREKGVEKYSSASTEDFVKNDLDQFATENSINTQDEIAFWNKCIEESDTREEAMQMYLDSAKQITEPFDKLSVTDTVEKLKKEIKPVFDGLASAYDDVFKDGLKENFTLENVDIDTLDSIKSAIEGFNEVDGIDIPMEHFERFAEVLTNTDSTAEDVQEQFDHLVDVILSASAIEVTGENFDILRQTLTQLGVTNAEEVLNNIATASELCTKYGYNLNEVTVEQINHIIDEEGALAGEGEAFADTINAMIDYYLTKIDLNNNSIDVSKDLDALEALYNALGNTAEQAAILSKIKIALKMLDDVGVNMGANARETLMAQIEAWQQQLLDSRTYSFNHHYGGNHNNNNGSGSGSGSDSDNQSEEIFDWIEVRLKRLQEALKIFEDRANDTFKSLSKRVQAYGDAISTLSDEINTQTQAQQRYLQEANAVGLAEEWAQKVRDGSIDISKITDEKLKEQIQKYQEWYEKAKACGDVLDELNKKLTELKIAKIQIEIDIDQKKLDKLEAKLDKLQFRLDLSQLFGGLGSASVYNAMNDNLQNQIANLRQQNELMAEQASLVERGSEAWWEYQNSINSNNSSINSLLQTIAQNAQSIANLRNDRANQRVEELDNLDELTSLRMQNSSGNYKRQNRYVSEENANIERRQREYAQAVANNKESLKNSRTEINKIKRNKENKDIIKEVKKYTKAKKQIPTSLLEKASKLNDNGVLYTALVKYNAALSALETSQQTADLYDQQSAQDKIDLVRQRMSNIEAYYGNRQGMLDQRATRVNNAMNLAEAQGHATSTAYYKQLRSLESKKRNSLIAERDALQKELEDGMRNGTIRQYSDEWYELVQRIDDVTNAIDESSIALQNYDNQIRQIKWDRFDELQEKIRGISEELNFLINELSRKKLSDEDTGWMTEEGVAVATLRLGNYRQYLTLRDDLLKEINSIDKQIEKNPADTTLIARKEELYQRYRDVIQSAQDEKYAIIELYKQGYDALIARIGTLISEYTDLLDAEKDAYDYQQKIADATKNIATLRKQLIAYSGDVSEETRSKIQKITVELEDAEKNLRETQNDHMISEQKKMLSEFKDDIQENIQDIIDNLDDNFDKLVNELKNSTSAMETVRDTINDVGYRASDNIDNILNGDNIWKDTKTEIVSIKEQQAELIRIAESIASSVNTDGANNEAGKTAFKNDRRSTNSALREAKSKYESYNIEGVKAGLAKASEDYSVAGIKYSEQQKIVHESNIRYMNALKKYGSDDPETIRLRKEFESNLDTLNKYKKERDEALSRIKESEFQLAEYKRLEKQYNDAKQAKLVMDFLNTRLTTTASSRNGLNDINKVFYDNYGQRVISDSEIEELAKLLGLKKLNGTNSSSELYKKLKSIGIPGFKIGSRNILEKQIALLGENGMELQFRKAQGTLGVVGQGDKIFTNEQAENLWKISKMNISDFIPNFTTNIPSFAGSHVGNKNINISIGDIILPDVTNTEQFASALKDVVKNNTSVQRLLKDSTIGTLSRNNNSLSIRKY